MELSFRKLQTCSRADVQFFRENWNPDVWRTGQRLWAGSRNYLKYAVKCQEVDAVLKGTLSFRNIRQMPQWEGLWVLKQQSLQEGLFVVVCHQTVWNGRLSLSMMTGQFRYRHISVSHFFLSMREIIRFDYLRPAGRSVRGIDCAEPHSDN